MKRERENRYQSKHHALRELEQWRYMEKILIEISPMAKEKEIY